MSENSNVPKIILKKKQVQTMVDFCLDEGIEFGVKQQTFPDMDFEIEMKLKDMKVAILVGMFLRENRFEINRLKLLLKMNPKEKIFYRVMDYSLV